MAMVVQLLVLLCLFFSTSGSSDVFRAVGDSVQLEIQNHGAEINILSWICNGSKNVLDYIKIINHTTLYPDYKDRVVFNNKTYSLTLKNLQKTDSGLYEAKASGVTVAEYRLSVIDLVEKPVLNYHHINNTCNTTLTCRGHDLSINSSCYNVTCEEKNETSGHVTLALFVRDDRIICNYSNPVSWEEDELELKELRKAFSSEGVDPTTTPEPDPILRIVLIAVGIMVGIVGIILISILIWQCFFRKKQSGPPQCETTNAEDTNNGGATLPMTELETTSTQPNPDNQEASEQKVTSLYDTVPDPKPLDTKPETIYATVNKPGKPNV